MFTNVVLPNLGFGMEEGRVIAWLKRPGDGVHKGEPIAEIESDKATVELESVAEGVLAEILVPEGDIVPIDTVLARIRTADVPAQVGAQPASATPPAASPNVTPVAQRMAREHGVDLSAVTGSGPGGRITREDVESAIAGRVDAPKTSGVFGDPRAQPPANGNRERPPDAPRNPRLVGTPLAAPAVRKLARDSGLDLRTISGSGTGGRITRQDVEAALRRVAAQPATMSAASAGIADDRGRREVPLTNLRAAIARALSHSMQEAPHFYLTAELDLTQALANLPPETGINALILYLTVQTLKDIPALNATFENGKLYQYDHVHLSVAVAVDDGLISPVLRNADDYSLIGLAGRAGDLIARARAGRLRADELSGGTFTVSNLGVVRQVDRFTAIINPPQVGILAAGAAKDRPVVIDGGLHIRKTIHLTLSADHRVIDGLVAGRFLEAFDNRLQAFAQQKQYN